MRAGNFKSRNREACGDATSSGRVSPRTTCGIAKTRTPIEQANPPKVSIQKRKGCPLEVRWPNQYPLNSPVLIWSKSVTNTEMPTIEKSRPWAIDFRCAWVGQLSHRFAPTQISLLKTRILGLTNRMATASTTVAMVARYEDL